jgi:hypothetical protein
MPRWSSFPAVLAQPESDGGRTAQIHAEIAVQVAIQRVVRPLCAASNTIAINVALCCSRARVTAKKKVSYGCSPAFPRFCQSKYVALTDIAENARGFDGRPFGERSSGKLNSNWQSQEVPWLLDFAGTAVNAVTINKRAYFRIATAFGVVDFAEDEFEISFVVSSVPYAMQSSEIRFS